MSNLYKVSLKLGQRSITLNLHSSSIANIQTFVNNNLYAEINYIYKIEYEAPVNKTFPVDDLSKYKGATYFHCRNNTGASKVILIQAIKSSRSLEQVFADMKSYLDLTSTLKIDSFVNIKTSSKGR